MVLTKDDYPQYEQPRVLPAGFLNVMQWQYEQMDLIAGLNKPAQGADSQAEVSGVARKIAVSQSLVSLGRMQQAVKAARERHWRIKLEMAMRYFTAPQLLRYVGADGAYKQEWFTGNDFALASAPKVKAGTGTLMPPEQKVQYISSLQAAGFMDADEAQDAARPVFAGVLGVPESPHLQRVERQVSSWLEGPPENWLPLYQQYQQQKAVYDQQVAQIQQAYQAEVQQHQLQEQDNAQMGETIGVRPVAPQVPPPQPQLPPPPTPPWTPFAFLPMDDEPSMMATTEFTAQGPEWRTVVQEAYTTARQAVAAAQGALAGMPNSRPAEQAARGAQEPQDQKRQTQQQNNKKRPEMAGGMQ